MDADTTATGFEIGEIMRLLPHRYPMLLVDRVLRYTAFESLLALKNVTVNEPFFQGHFPAEPVMPGVLILEALAQATGLLAFKSLGQSAVDGTVYYLVGVDKARFKRPVRPGDQLLMEVRLTRQIRGIYQFSAVGTVSERVVATAEFMTTKSDLKA
jgi:3-hydroxyacyl-[acyl-carrier-protein] dehydratase